MADAESKLRETATDIIEDIGALRAVEIERRSLDPGDPAIPALADKAVEIASRVIPKTRRERSLAEEVSGQ